MPATAAAEKEQPATRFAKDQLKAIVERIERLEEEKKATSDDIRDVYAEAKGNGFDVKALRTIVRMRKHGHRRAPRAAGSARDLHARARDVAVSRREAAPDYRERRAVVARLRRTWRWPGTPPRCR